MKLLDKIRSIGFFIPFSLQLVILLITLFTGYIWLDKHIASPDSSYDEIIHLLVKITLVFLSLLLTFSFITVFIPWVWFMIKRSNNTIMLSIKTSNEKTFTSQKPQVSIILQPAITPLFGFIRFRIGYDGGESRKFTLVSSKRNTRFFEVSIDGVYNWPAPDIREYNIHHSIIYFEDLCQLFSFAALIPIQDTFVSQPKNMEVPIFAVMPKKTLETNVRINDIRKVEGEFLNYKNFENNDDVRRIVWKIYAKNKELVVRTPETNDPYASHIYFYASFYNHLNNEHYDDFARVFLNHFKTLVWNVYRELSTQKILINFIPDQQPGLSFSDDPLQKVKYTISTSEWQTGNDLEHYFKIGEASVLCISSFTDKKDVENIVATAGEDLVIVFIQLSKRFTRLRTSDRLQWIFVRPSVDGLEQLRLAWHISPFKSKILRNEKDILDLLQRSECEKHVL